MRLGLVKIFDVLSRSFAVLQCKADRGCFDFSNFFCSLGFIDCLRLGFVKLQVLDVALPGVQGFVLIFQSSTSTPAFGAIVLSFGVAQCLGKVPIFSVLAQPQLLQAQW